MEELGDLWQVFAIWLQMEQGEKESGECTNMCIFG